MVAHWVSRVNAVAGYPVDVPVQTIRAPDVGGPCRPPRALWTSLFFARRSSPRRTPKKGSDKRDAPKGRGQPCRWTPPSRSISAPKRRLRWRTARASHAQVKGEGSCRSSAAACPAIPLSMWRATPSTILSPTRRRNARRKTARTRAINMCCSRLPELRRQP